MLWLAVGRVFDHSFSSRFLSLALIIPFLYIQPRAADPTLEGPAHRISTGSSASASASKPALPAAAAAQHEHEEEVMEQGEEEEVVLPEGWAPEEIPSSLVSALGANLTVQVRNEEKREGGREGAPCRAVCATPLADYSPLIILCTMPLRHGQDPSFVLACLEAWVSHTYHQVCRVRGVLVRGSPPCRYIHSLLPYIHSRPHLPHTTH